MTRTPRLLAVLITLLLATGLTAFAPAQAERLIHHDRTGDVRVLRIQSFDDDLEFVRAPHRKQGDYVKVKMWHQVKWVRVVGKFRQLDRRGLGLSQFVAVRTPRGFHYFEVDAGPGAWKGTEIDESVLDGGDGDLGDTDSACMRHHVNYQRDRFAMRISRACLGRPAWVKVGVAFVAVDRRSVGIDAPLGRDFFKGFKLSPRLVHGEPR